ncbi:TrmO family methyltransferase [Streptomyces sp. NBC_01591]|uniref:TrmO family methyltransferase domain-containing protein n=1 Tax=Streptomyces sp. NBC_01591 TaxID=2975888 RepID=UPI002DD8E5E1|nr:TrmO family methyltransferase [Streptomyces sp. NBC_01591]WSD66566.1 TrmO family methyltransferase [Streptomyces sp. NBC_01591]
MKWCSSSTKSTARRSTAAPVPSRAWPAGRTLVGVFAQRSRRRPNRLGVSICRLTAVDGLDIRVSGLDVAAGAATGPAGDETGVLAHMPPRPRRDGMRGGAPKPWRGGGTRRVTCGVCLPSSTSRSGKWRNRRWAALVVINNLTPGA